MEQFPWNNVDSAPVPTGLDHTLGLWRALKLAIIADIHGNLEALEAVLVSVEEIGVHQIVCLGDILGYGADSVACINRLREVEAQCVLGDHDQVADKPGILRHFNSFARETLLHTLPLLDDTHVAFLGSSPMRRIEGGAALVHAHPVVPQDWPYLLRYNDFDWCLRHMRWPLSFIGHTHHQVIYCRMGKQVLPLTSTRVAVNRHSYLINPGSVGQPRDGDWRAAFAVWDRKSEVVELHRVEYPVQKTQAKIRALDWPPYLAERLARGE